MPVFCFHTFPFSTFLYVLFVLSFLSIPFYHETLFFFYFPSFSLHSSPSFLFLKLDSCRLLLDFKDLKTVDYGCFNDYGSQTLFKFYLFFIKSRPQTSEFRPEFRDKA